MLWGELQDLHSQGSPPSVTWAKCAASFVSAERNGDWQKVLECICRMLQLGLDSCAFLRRRVF